MLKQKQPSGRKTPLRRRLELCDAASEAAFAVWLAQPDAVPSDTIAKAIKGAVAEAWKLHRLEYAQQ